ncbi:hypothetical protein PIB30_090553 [Stylosanthes scabra]|uniref:Uncharacterized protein n=1 Tax=Stylosanthes scabra TaxID=79078 RepID=A0ABU6XW40_9FABA|nr:hypothetical protein [Stylosanthes scabra]
MGVSSFLIWYAGTLALVTPMARTMLVARYCRKLGRQPARLHCRFGSRYVITVTFFLLMRGSKLYTLVISFFHKNSVREILIFHKTLSKAKTYLHNRFRRGRIDSKIMGIDSLLSKSYFSQQKAQRIDAVAGRIDSLELYCTSAELSSLKLSNLLLPRPIPTIFKSFYQS